MKSLFQNTFVTIVLVMILLTGCMKHAPVIQPELQPDVVPRAEANNIIVARVNNAGLSMDSLVKMMNRFPTRDNSGTPESLEDHKRRSLDKLVLLELAYQQAKSQGLAIPAEKINLAIQNLKENVGGEKEYAEYLLGQNVTESQLRAQVERSLMIELIYAKEVLARVSIPEDVLRREYEREKLLYIVQEKTSVIDVFIPRNGGTVSKKKSRKLLDKIKADPDNNPWNLVLDGSFSIRNREIIKDKEKELYETAKKLKQHEVSDVIITPAGNHIIKLKDYSPERQLAFDEVRSRLELKFKVPAQEKRTEEWEQELKEGAEIEILEKIENGKS